MKKICICTTVSITMKTFVVETAKYLYEKEGYDITLICDDDQEFQKTLPEYIHYLPLHMARGIDISALRSVWGFIKIFRKEKFDMVQYATPNAAYYASIAARVCRVPIRLYCQWGIRYIGMRGISRKIFRIIEKIICTNSTNIRAVSRLNKQFAISEKLYTENKVKVIGYGGTIGVDMAQYDIHKKKEWREEIRELYGISENDFVFGFSGRISRDKGCKELLEAFSEIEKITNRAKLFIIGPVEGKCGIRPELITWAKKSKNVIMSGAVLGSQMQKYYSAIDVLVHPTYREGFGMVIQEAGALGIPTITTAIAGASEVMENGISAVHVEVKNTVALTEAMKAFLKEPEQATMLGKAAYQRTKERYNRSVMLEYQREDYKQLLAGSR